MKFHLSYLSPALLLGALVPTAHDPEGSEASSAVKVKAAAKHIDRLVDLLNVALDRRHFRLLRQRVE